MEERESLVDDRQTLVNRCLYLMRIYDKGAMLITTKQNALANGLWEICSDPQPWDVKLGGGLRLDIVEMRARDALKRLRA